MALKLADDSGAHCTYFQQFDYELTWIPECTYVAGTEVELRSGCLRSFHYWKYVRMEMDRADVLFRWKAFPTVSERGSNPERILLRARLPYGAQAGEAIAIRLRLIPPVYAGVYEHLSLWINECKRRTEPNDPEPHPYPEKNSACELPAMPGPVEQLAVHACPAPGEQGTVRTAIVPRDRFGNPSHFATPVRAGVAWQGETEALDLRGREVLELAAPETVGRCEVRIAMEDLEPDENISNGIRQGDSLVVTGNPVWAQRPDRPRPAFGEFHWHSDLSGDGIGSYREGLRRARDDMNLDFASSGDHNPAQAAWKETVDALEAFNENDRFATFFGWEDASQQGHQNYYFTDPDHPLVCGGKAGVDHGGPTANTARLDQWPDLLTIPHHTNATAETRDLEDDTPLWHPYPWNRKAASIRLVEIMQVRGNQERNEYSDAWRGWHQGNGASVQDALARGYRLGFTGGTDNHTGWPGRAWDYAEDQIGGNYPPCSEILTGIWTSRVERQAAFDALAGRHTWAVWDCRALVWIAVNGAAMGEDLTVSEGEVLTMTVKLSAEDALQSLEIVCDGECAWQRSYAELDIDQEIALGPLPAGEHYVYLRALQRNGGLIYASPVFVTVENH